MSEQLIEIQGCQVSQYLPGNSEPGKTDIPMADGPLALFASKETDSQLKLVCGTAAFALDKSHPFYTHSESQRIYVFSPFLPEGDAAAKTYVKVLLPEGVIEQNSEAMKQRDAFEGILIERGFLKTEGIEAMAAEYGADVASEIKAKAAEYTSSTPGGDVGKFSDGTHTFADRAVEYSQVAAEYSAEFSKAVGNAAVTAGAKISSFVQNQTKDNEMLHGESGIMNDPKVKETADKLKAGASTVGASISSVGAGIAAGFTSFYNSAKEAAQDTIQHEFGGDAAKLSSQAGTTTENTGNAASEAFLATSVPFHAAKGAEGAQTGESAKQ